MSPKSFLKTHTHERQLQLLEKQHGCRPKAYRDPGVQTPEDFTNQVVWVYNNVWKPGLSPADCPWPSWWTLVEIAREDKAGFVRDYLKPLMVNTAAQKAVRENAKNKAAPKEEDGPQLDTILGK